jgi:hypothetical protein
MSRNTRGECASDDAPKESSTRRRHCCRRSNFIELAEQRNRIFSVARQIAAKGWHPRERFRRDAYVTVANRSQVVGSNLSSAPKNLRIKIGRISLGNIVFGGLHSDLVYHCQNII